MHNGSVNAALIEIAKKMSNTTGLIPDPNIWQTTGMIIPAVMTLICFICTAVSLTVSGFICLRDKEAQDESDNKVKHQKQQEFVSKALGTNSAFL